MALAGAHQEGQGSIYSVLMTDEKANQLPEELRQSLSRDFFIRFTTTGRRSGAARTSETTFVWRGESGGAHSIYVSGYPGMRDWLANARSNPTVTIHTVERGVYYDIPATARVIVDRGERTPPLLWFLDRWANRPEAKQRVFGWIVSSIRLNHRLRLPWWGPFYVARRVMDRMPCLELTFDGPPVRRSTFPPSASAER